MARGNKYTSINFNEIYEKKAATTTNGSSPASAIGRYSLLSSAAHSGKSYSSVSSRSHGMLVLSRPSPKPVSHPQPPPQTQPQTQPKSNPLAKSQPQHNHQSHSSPLLSSARPQTPPDSESISLRPLGKTGATPSLISTPPSTLANPSPVTEREKESSPVSLPKSDKFVPPHMRPGFAPKEGRPATPPGGGRASPGGGRGRDSGGYRPGALGSSPNRYGDDRRPKSGSGYERTIGRRGAGYGGGGGGHEFGHGEMNTMNRPRSGGYRPGSSG